MSGLSWEILSLRDFSTFDLWISATGKPSKILAFPALRAISAKELEGGVFPLSSCMSLRGDAVFAADLAF